MKEPKEKKKDDKSILNDVFGGVSAMLVALPSAIAFGLIIYAPLGPDFSSRAAIGGIMGTIMIGILASAFGGTSRLISAPCAPAAAVLGVFVTETIHKGNLPHELIPIYIMIISFIVGLVQIILGKIKGGAFIKYIPYPVVAGYLSGVGVIIFSGQVPKFLGLPKDIKFWQGLTMVSNWKPESIIIGSVTIVAMLMAPKLIKSIPAAIIALLVGVLTYFGLALFNSNLLVLENNSLVIGQISASLSNLQSTFTNQWSAIPALNISSLTFLIVPALTLAVLLSIDTLKTCVVLDAVTFSRHNSNKELIGQGIGNIGSALMCGIPGAGTMGATLVNLNSGGKTKASGLIFGVSALAVLLLLGNLVAWIPVSALAGILIVVAYRMVDFHSVELLKHKTTIFDFFVVLGVIISAVTLSLIAAAGIGIFLAIILFLRGQMSSSVIRRKAYGNQLYSKKTRMISERETLNIKGRQTFIVELQGQLFFGTADQLLSEIEPSLNDCKDVILDLRRVQSIDYTAVNRLKQILGRIKEQDGHLIFSSIPSNLASGLNIKEYLKHLGLTENDNFLFFENLDAALEWVEEKILSETEEKDINKMLLLKEIELFNGFHDKALTALTSCLEEREFKKGDYVFKIKSEGDQMFFVKKGVVKIQLPLAGGNSHHLATISKGDFFGDMAFLDKLIRSADAIASEDVLLYELSRKKFDEITKNYPEISGQFFEKLAFVIANRLRLANIEINTLQD